MNPLPVRLVQVGNSTVLAIPPAIARLFRWEPGCLMRLVLPDVEPFERKLITLYGGKGIGATIPPPVLAALGVARGDSVTVPFHEWEVLEAPPKGRAAQKRAVAKKR